MRKIIILLSLLFFNDVYAKKVVFMLEWFVNPDHASLIIAKQKGYFKEQGLDVNFIEPSDPALPPKLVSLGKIDYAVHYQNSLQMQSVLGFKNVRVGTIVGQPLDTIMTIEGNGINKIADLKGKKIGFPISGGVSEAMIKTMLEYNGLTLDDVELVNINWQISQSLVTRKVDAVVGGPRNFNIPELRKYGIEGKAFYPEENGLPNYEELILITNRANASSDTTKKIVRSIQKAVLYIKNNPEKAWNEFKKYKPDTLDNKLNKQIWDLTYPLLANDTAYLNKEIYKKNAVFLYDNKLVDKKLPPIDTYTINPLKQ
ncbi:MAG: ABC transporter substrate-binding protein [Alphaproteobacteria bacterium]